MDLLKDKVAIITGAASGMGKAQAYLFAKEGAKVVLVDINEESLKEIEQKIGENALAIKADISCRDDVANVVSKTLEKYGTVDIVSNTAGIFDGYHPLMETSEELFDKVYEINSKGIYLMTKLTLPIMLEKEKGVYVNVASIASFNGTGGGFAYTASKSAVLGMTRSVASIYKEKGIRANSICPGLVETSMVSHLTSDKNVVNNVCAKSVRVGTPEDIANAALFLASDKADYINGVSLPVDGGWLAE